MLPNKEPTTKAGQQFEQLIEILDILRGKNKEEINEFEEALGREEERAIQEDIGNVFEDMDKIWDELKKRPEN